MTHFKNTVEHPLYGPVVTNSDPVKKNPFSKNLEFILKCQKMLHFKHFRQKNIL